MSSPNDPLTPQTPFIQALAQIAFWEMKTDAEKTFAKNYARDAKGFQEDLIELLKNFATTFPPQKEIELHQPGSFKTIQDIAQELTLEQVLRLEKSIPSMIKLVYQKTEGQGWTGFFYNWMQKFVLKDPSAHWGWAQKILENRPLIWKDPDFKNHSYLGV